MIIINIRIELLIIALATPRTRRVVEQLKEDLTRSESSQPLTQRYANGLCANGVRSPYAYVERPAGGQRGGGPAHGPGGQARAEQGASMRTPKRRLMMPSCT